MKKFFNSRALITIFAVLALLLIASGQPVYASSPHRPADPISPVQTPLPLDAQSTTGPNPPSDFSMMSISTPVGSTLTIDVPPYLWTHGCGPTAVGMVMGFWDLRGFSQLYPTSESYAQNTAINEFIASSAQTRSHYNDYAMPIDDREPMIMADACTPPGCIPHTDNSIADFMLTSRFSRGNRYGWSYFLDLRNSMTAYVNFINMNYSRQYQSYTNSFYYSSALWNLYKTEIDEGRPVIFLVDSNGDASTDHFVVATGYGWDAQGNPLYRFNNTWDDNKEHWATFKPMVKGDSWGIYGMVTFSISGTDLPSAPNAPEIISATPISENQIDLAWTDNSLDETNFLIERSLDGVNNWLQIGSLSANVTSFTSIELSCGTTYYYRMRSYRSTDNLYSTYSSVVNATTHLCTEPPSITVAQNSYRVGEFMESISIPVNLSTNFYQDISIPYTLTSGTAVLGEDFATSSSTLVIPAGQTSGAIGITLINDDEIEPEETFELTLGTPSHGTLASPNTVVITIYDREFLFIPIVVR